MVDISTIRNWTDAELTEENTQVDEWDIGFIKAQCPVCGASLYLSDSNIVMCLNNCYLPSRVLERELAKKEVLADD